MNTYNSDVDGAKALVEKYEILRKEIGKVIVGQHDIIHNTILSIFCQGHVLLVGVPGLAKTLLVNTIAHDGRGIRGALRHNAHVLL